MSATVLTVEAAEKANVKLLHAPKGDQAVHDLITAYRANRRSGSANTKLRSEVAGSGKKIYRQKGTGNARHGDRQAPIFVGGGVVFGPRPRSYAKQVPKSVRKVALRRVLSDRIAEEAIHVVDSFKVEDGKTKSFLAAIAALTDASKVLVIAQGLDEVTKRAARNVKSVLLISPDEVNIEQMLHANAIVIDQASLTILANRTA